MSTGRSLLSATPGGRTTSRSNARPTPGAPSRQQQPRTIELPPYEEPSCPLDAQARRALTELSTNASETRKYNEQLSASLKLLGEGVAEANDRLGDRRARLKGRLERLQGEEGGGEMSELDKKLESAVRKLEHGVPEATKRSEEAVRQIIDWRIELEDNKAALSRAVGEVEADSARAVAILERNAAARDNVDEMDEDQDEEEQEVEITGAREFWEKQRNGLKADYEGKTLHQRYALSNDYIQFKKMWHDATHGREGRPLPDASRWFRRQESRNEDEAAEEGQEDEEEDEDDEDLIVASEKKDLRCPLSMVVMSEPYTSNKCNHTFERTAIAEFLSNKPGRKAQCPQTGCSQEVSIRDFTLDQVMLRRIKRAQAENDEDDDDVDDEMGDEEEADQSMRVTSQRHVKRERRDRDGIEDDEDEE